jgi:hypothetical protein
VVRAATKHLKHHLGPFANASVATVRAAYEAILLEMGWDGKDNRLRLDDAVGPWPRNVDYLLRARGKR